ALKDRDLDVRVQVLAALDAIGHPAVGAERVPDVVELLITGKIDASAAIKGLGAHPKAGLPLLLAAFDHDDAAVRWRAEDTVANLWWCEEVVPALVGALKSDAARRRAGAARTLGRSAFPAEVAVPALREALQDPVPEVRFLAALALVAIDPSQAEAAVPTLTAVLADPDEARRVTAAEHLARLGPRAGAAVPALLKLHQSEARLVPRLRAAEAILAIDPSRGEVTVPTLVEALGDGDAAVRRSAAQAAGLLGPLARKATPGLLTATEAKEPHLRLAAAEALFK